MATEPAFHYHDRSGRNRGCRQCQRDAMNAMAVALVVGMKQYQGGDSVTALTMAIDTILDEWPRR